MKAAHHIIGSMTHTTKEWLRLSVLIATLASGAELAWSGDCSSHGWGGISGGGSLSNRIGPGQLELSDGYVVYEPQHDPRGEKAGPQEAILDVAIFKDRYDRHGYAQGHYGRARPEPSPSHPDGIINVRYPGMDSISIDDLRLRPAEDRYLAAYFQLIVSQADAVSGFRVTLDPNVDPRIVERVDVDLIMALVRQQLHRLGRTMVAMDSYHEYERGLIPGDCQRWTHQGPEADPLELAYTHD